MNIITYKICNYQTDSRQSFNSHISHKHHINSKEYYDKYLKKENEGICPSCGKITKFRNMWYGYNEHCSKRCIPLDPNIQNKMKQTCLERYGTEYSFQSDQVKSKIKSTIQKHYGVDSYLQTKECRELSAKVSASEEVKQKIKNTFMSRYGVNTGFKLESMKQKSKQTKLERYGNEKYNNSTKAKLTSFNKYGVSNPAKSNKVQSKIKKTCLERYGVDNIWKSRKFKLNHLSNSQKSMHKNGNDSSLEDLLENALISHNIKYEKQYNLDKRYPYFCDFYLPDTDLFIEINGYFTHNGHWFNKKNQNDLHTLEDWKEKSKVHSLYKTCIRVWTDSDVKKRNSAKRHKLNYVVLWSRQDINQWIDSNFEIRHDY